MYCSDCGKKIRPVVVFDIDGTLANYHDTFVDFCDVYFNHQFKHDWDGTGNWEDFLGLTRAEYREVKLAYRQGGHKRWLPLYAGASHMFMSFRANPRYECEIWIATTRPWDRLDNIDPDTREWLRRNRFNVDGLLFGEDKYKRLIQAVDHRRVVACTDDLVNQVNAARMEGLPIMQVYRQHNSGPGLRVRPGGSLAVITEWIKHNIDEWNRKNG